MATAVHPLLAVNIAKVDERLRRLFSPPPDMLVSEWAEKYRILPKGTTARPGPYVCEPFQRDIMDAICDPERKRVTCMKSTQVGWTELLLNIIGWCIDTRPMPMMFVLVRNTDAADKSKKTVAPMIAECPTLREKVRQNRSRTGGNTQLLKQFDGGFLKLAGANSAANLRSDPINLLLLDEVDGYTDNADGEGDPIVLARRRLDSFEDDRELLGSTPARPKKFSRVAQSYEASDQRMYHVPCPRCDEMQPLLWRNPETQQPNVIWEKDRDGKPLPGSVRYVCRKCSAPIEESMKHRMLERGRWIAKYPERTKHAGFYINALYSPWKPIWEEMAIEWVEAQGIPDKMRAFVNLRLGECYEEGLDVIEPESLEARCEDYDPENTGVQVPMGAAVLVCTVDVQHNRLEAKVTAFGPEDEEWHVDHQIFWGAPGIRPGDAQNEDVVNVWDELDEYRLKLWKHASGAMLKPAITFVDMGAYSDAVAAFVMPRQDARSRVYACKGFDYLTRPGLVDESTGKKHKVRLFRVGTVTGKDRVLSRLQVPRPEAGKVGANYMHFPLVRVAIEGGEQVKVPLPLEYFRQLTAETKIPVVDKRTRRTRFVYAMNHERNEILDLTVYAHAARVALQTIVDPVTYGDLKALHAKVCEGGAVPQTLVQLKQRRVRSAGIQI